MDQEGQGLQQQLQQIQRGIQAESERCRVLKVGGLGAQAAAAAAVVLVLTALCSSWRILCKTCTAADGLQPWAML